MDAPQVEVAPAAPTFSASATELRAPTNEQVELCRKASDVDWAYLGAMVVADGATIALDSQVFQSQGSTGVRLVGPGLVGLAWGWSVGGTYLTLPQCSTGFASGGPIEGSRRSHLPLAVSFSVLAAATAPIVVGVETGEGNQTLTWSPAERVMRLVLAGTTGAVGSVMPYVLPPRTWRALRALEHLRAGATARGGAVYYSVAF